MESAPKVRPWKEFSSARIRVFGRRRVACFARGVRARQLQRAFDRFGAAIGEENAIHARPFGEFARQRPLIRIVK